MTDPTNYIGWLRGLVGHARLPLVYVTGVVRDAAGRVLFQRRSDFGDAWWGLPGGLLELGEGPEAALAREVLEETGLTVRVGRLTGLYSSMRYAFAYPNGDEVQQVTLCYACDVLGGALAPQAGEVEALTYFPPEALPKTSVWYADMLTHALGPEAPPYLDPPEAQVVEAPYPDLIALRHVIGHAPLVWPGASAVVFDEAGSLLLQQRSDNGFWGLPGGLLDLGESLAHTARRECAEETGLVVEPLALIGCQGGRLATLPNGHQLYALVALVACRVTGGALRADSDEALNVGYFARDALPPTSDYLWPRMQLAFEWWESGSRQ